MSSTITLHVGAQISLLGTYLRILLNTHTVREIKLQRRIFKGFLEDGPSYQTKGFRDGVSKIIKALEFNFGFRSKQL